MEFICHFCRLRNVLTATGHVRHVKVLGYSFNLCTTLFTQYLKELVKAVFAITFTHPDHLLAIHICNDGDVAVSPFKTFLINGNILRIRYFKLLPEPKKHIVIDFINDTVIELK